MEVGRQALLVISCCAPVLLTALAIGLAIGMIQAATQIQEMTLSFIPKLLGHVHRPADRRALDAGSGRGIHHASLREHPRGDRVAGPP
jgi:hypothetical protein